METVQNDATEIHADIKEDIHLPRKSEMNGTRQAQQKRKDLNFPPWNSCGKTNHKQNGILRGRFAGYAAESKQVYT